MYESFFGLRKAPFDLSPDPSLLVLTDTHAEALSNLEYGISRQKGIVLLTGLAGSGKTTVIRAVMTRQTQQVHCVYLNNPALTRPEFVEILATRFQLSAQAARSKAACLEELDQLLRQRRDRGEATVLVVDEAQSLSLGLLEEIRLLANIEKQDEKLLCIVLAGQPGLAERLDNPALSQLKQRIELRHELRPLTALETATYLVMRIKSAGGVARNLFTRDAVEAIHQHSNGIPRMISVLADNALLTAFALGHRTVTRNIVLEVSREFRLNGNGQRAAVSEQTPAHGTVAPRASVVPKAPAPEAENAVGEATHAETTMFDSLRPKRRRLSVFG